MKILEVKKLAIPDVKVIRFERFMDARGYFTETARPSDFKAHPETKFLADFEFHQSNESFSRANVLRGLHFQWNPFMGKLVRCIQGRIIDLALDIRKGSPTYGKAVTYEMPTKETDAFGQWIWIPAGFAHGILFLTDSTVEYFCTGVYNSTSEDAINPLSPDIDWSLAERPVKIDYIMSPKDRGSQTLGQWSLDARSNEFLYEKLK